jgi:hypothetical protein
MRISTTITPAFMRTTLITALFCTASLLWPCAHAQPAAIQRAKAGFM